MGTKLFGGAGSEIAPSTDKPVKFADLGGVDEAIEDMREIVDFLRTPERFTKLGGMSRGIGLP